MGIFDRRSLLGGLAALLAGPAQGADSPIAHGVLADNRIAKRFQVARRDLPDIDVWGPDGRRNIHEIAKDKTILMPLWAEWCAPCIMELPDFGRLQRKYGNDKFAIVPVLTATQKRFTPQLLDPILSRLVGGKTFEPLIEDHLGGMLANRMSDGRSALPCNLIIAPGGEVKGRILGAVDDAQAAAAGPQVKSYDDSLHQAEAGIVHSLWGRADGEAFAAAMADGFLTQS
jgi:thiol-disulfide isomerase/thioredoxin